MGVLTHMSAGAFTTGSVARVYFLLVPIVVPSGGGFNVVFLDGHVQWFQWEQGVRWYVTAGK